MAPSKKLKPSKILESSEPLRVVSIEAPRPPAPTPEGGLQAAWQRAHDALQTAFEQGNSVLDQTHDKHARDLLNNVLDVLSAELTSINREDMRSRTVSLQAASERLGGGIDSLESLQQEIDKIADTLAGAAEILSAIDGVLSGVKSFLAILPGAL